MYSIRISTTDDRLLPAPDIAAGLTWDLLAATLQREVGPDAAGLLAEPVRDEERGETHWLVEAEEEPAALADLPADERALVRERLAGIRARIRDFAVRLEARGGEANARLAAALRLAVEVPNEETCVWSLAGRPVLAAWGRRAESRSRADASILRSAPKPASAEADAPAAPCLPAAPAAPSTPLRPDASPPAALPVEPEAPARRRPVVWPGWLAPAALWLLFLLLAGMTGYHLLPACAVDLPVFGPALDACRAPVPRDLGALRARNAALRDAVQKAEMALALRQGRCASADAAPRRTPSPGADETDRRRRQAGLSHGALDITLTWNGHSDLDLRVTCPGGVISFETKTACGGVLELDRNRSQNPAELVDNAIEHITWSQDPPPGDYKVEVTLYKWNDAPQGPVPFTVVVRNGDDVREHSGVLQEAQTPASVAAFHR